MSPGPWSRIKRKTDHPMPSPPASIASFTSSDSSCSSSSSLNNFTCRVFGEAKADSPSDESPGTIIDTENSSVTCGPRDGDLYCNSQESCLLNGCDAFKLHGELSNHRAPLLIQQQQAPNSEVNLTASRSHLAKLDNFTSHQSNSESRSCFHMPKSPHHQVHPATRMSACEIDFGPGGTIRRKPSIHLNNPKLPLLSSTTRILANQPNEDSRVEIVPSSHVMSYSYQQMPDQLMNHQSQCQRNHANSHANSSIVSRSHASFTSCESDMNDQASKLAGNMSMPPPLPSPSLNDTPPVAATLSHSSSASFTASAKQSSDAQGQQNVSSGASVSRSCSTIIRNNIQYGTLKRNNSSAVNSHRIVRRVSNVPTTNRIIPFDSLTSGERVSLHSLNSVESSDFSSSSSSSASSVCSSSSNGTHSPSSCSSYVAANCGTKLNDGVLCAPSRSSNQSDSASSIEAKVSFPSSSSSGGVNLMPTFATSTSSSSSYSLNCSSCKCTRVNCTPLSSMHTISNTSSDSLASSVAVFANQLHTFPSSTLCKSCRSETSSILSRSVSMMDEEDDQSDDFSINADQELLSIEKCLRQLNLGHPFSPDQCSSDTTGRHAPQGHATTASAIVNETTSLNGHSNITTNNNNTIAAAAAPPVLTAPHNQSQVSHSPPALSLHRSNEINQCHAKNSCNNENNNEHQLRGNLNNGLVCSNISINNSNSNSKQSSPLHLRDSWSYAADASDDEELLPPPPLDDSRIMARLSNLSLDSLPPPPPELHSLTHSNTFGSLVKSESSYSLDSFPPPPPPPQPQPTSLPTHLQPRSQDDCSVAPRLLSSNTYSPCMSIVGSNNGHVNSSTMLPRHSINHLSHRGHEFIGRNINNTVTIARCKPAPPPPPRSESTRLSSLPLTSSSHPLSH